MTGKDEETFKYRIKSFHYEDCEEGRQLLFTIEEPGVAGELRKNAQEIMENKNWMADYAKRDVAKIVFAATVCMEGIEDFKNKNQ